MDMLNVTISNNVKYYIEAKLNRYNVLWRYKNGLKFRYKDQWIKADQFDYYYPNKEYIL